MRQSGRPKQPGPTRDEESGEGTASKTWFDDNTARINQRSADATQT
jgi:hypothetical protein